MLAAEHGRVGRTAHPGRRARSLAGRDRCPAVGAHGPPAAPPAGAVRGGLVRRRLHGDGGPPHRRRAAGAADRVRMAKKRMYFSPAKAIREIGLPQTDVRVALRDAVEWFAAHAMRGCPGCRCEPRQPELQVTRQNQSELLLRVPRAATASPRRALCRVRSAAPSTTSPTSAPIRARSARRSAVACGPRPLLRGGAIEHPTASAWPAPCGTFICRAPPSKPSSTAARWI